MKQVQASTPRWVTGIVKTGNLLERLLTIIGGITIVVFVSAVCLDVAARIVSHPLSWCQEIALFSYVWAIFMGSAIGVRYSTHFTIDLVINLAHGTIRKCIDLFDHVVIMIFAGVLTCYGWQYAWNTLNRLSQPSGIPMICGTICMFISAVAMLFFCLEYFILFFCEKADGQTESGAMTDGKEENA